MTRPLYSEDYSPEAAQSGGCVPGLTFRSRFDQEMVDIKTHNHEIRVQGKEELNRSAPNALNKLVGG